MLISLTKLELSAYILLYCSRITTKGIKDVFLESALPRLASLVMCGLGLKALKPRVPGPKKPGPAQPDIGLGGPEGRAFVYKSPSPALKPGLI